MQVLKPFTTGSQLLRLRVRPLDVTLPLTCSLEVGWDSWKSETVSCSVSQYDSNDFLNISCSIYGAENRTLGYQVYQVSGSNNKYLELYRGTIVFNNINPVLKDSEPILSYTGSKTEFIIF